MLDLPALFRRLRRIEGDLEDLQRLGPPRVFEGVATTTNATPTLIYRFGTSSNVCYLFRIQVVGRRTDVAGETAKYKRTLGAENIGGVVTLAAVGSDYTAEDDANWDVTFSVSGTDIQALVTGAVGKTISWKLRATLDQV